MIKYIFYLIVGMMCAVAAKAQPDCLFTHYSSEDGLSQNTVMSILQDHKGNMWFATWDGINKFDGYSFKPYKARLDNGLVLSHNRVDYMTEDRYGFLWLQTYDNHAYRFDPRTETFEEVTGEDGTASATNVTKIKSPPGRKRLAPVGERRRRPRPDRSPQPSPARAKLPPSDRTDGSRLRLACLRRPPGK